MNKGVAESAVILAPRGRDAIIAQAMLVEGGMPAIVAPSLAALLDLLRGEAGFVVLTEEALRGADLRDLAAWLGDQPTWSDLPFIVLTERGGGLERNPGAVRLLDTLGNVTFLERPFHPTTLLSLAKSARRARLRQYEARRRLADIDEGQGRLKIALSAGGLGAWELELRDNTLIAAPESKAHFGRAADEPFGYDDLIAAIHPDDRALVQAAARQAVEEDRDYIAEYRTIWPDGSLHWLQTNGRVERSPRGGAIRLVGVSREITRRRLVELRQAAFLRLNDGLRELRDPADMSFFAAEVLGETMRVGRAGYGTIDPVRETITVERDWNMPGIESLAGTLHFRDYGSYIEDLKRGVTAAIPDVRLDPRTADGAAALEAISARSFVNMPIVENGAFVALLYLNHDDTYNWTEEDLGFMREIAERTRTAIERRNAETALATLAETLERQVEERTRERDRTWRNTQDLLAAVGPGGTLLAVNPAWTRLLGWTEQEMVGQSGQAFGHPDEIAAGNTAYDDAAYDEAPGAPVQHYESRIRHKDGSWRWVAWIATDEDGIVYISGRHVTEEREARVQLEQAQGQLRQAQKMEAVGQLTGGIAHDFNNLLTAISGSLELIGTRIQQGRYDSIDRYIGMAQQGAKRAAALTHRLLAFSRRQTLDPKVTNANRLIASLDDLLRRSVGPSIELELVEAGGLWMTLVDPNQLENALLNLCINARDAMPEGGRITIETANKWLDSVAAKERDLPPGQYISVCVTDTGTGMSAETIERAFDPFYTTKPLGEGTGLGLSMIYGFARQSGGQVRIYSELGQGTTMCLYLPRAHADEEQDDDRGLIEGASAAGGGETVLVVDDEPAVRLLVVDILEDLGYTAIEAGDGPAGLAIIETEQRIDLLITDVGLPKGMNGRQFADAARTYRPDLKILFITGYAENAVVGNGHLDPGMHVLTKPFGMGALAGRIRDLIAG